MTAPVASSAALRGTLIWIPLAALLVACSFVFTPLNAIFSRPGTDWQERLLAPKTSPASVVVIDIDDASLADMRPVLGTWPFKRDVYALAIDQLRESGARAIAIDLLLADPREGDTALARAMARDGAPVVLAAAGLRYAREGAVLMPGVWDSALPRPAATLASASAAASASASGSAAAASAAALAVAAQEVSAPASAAQVSLKPPAHHPALSQPPSQGEAHANAQGQAQGHAQGQAQPQARPPAQHWPSMAMPSPTLWPSADQPPTIGVISMPLDDDGRLRRLPLWHQWRDQRIPMLSLAVWLALGGEPNVATQAAGSASTAASAATTSEVSWPLDAQGRIGVAFPGAQKFVSVLPFSKLARPALGLESSAELTQAVQGRVVFIGSSALLADTAMTVNGQSSGTAILAHTYEALRSGRLLGVEPAWAQAALMVLALSPSWLTWRRGRASIREHARLVVLATLAIAAMVGALLMLRHSPTLLAAAIATLTTGLVATVVARQRGLALEQRRLELERIKALAANQAKSDFLANVSHEIRTPMNALLGVAELLNETSLTAAQRCHVQVFRESGHSLKTLINDLLDLSKIEAGRFEIDSEPFSLTDLLARLCALMRPLAEQKGLRFVFESAADVPDAVRGDPKRLQQSLANLLNNAIKFTSQGSISLQVSCEPSCEAPGNASANSTAATQQLVIKVTDTGIGIAAPQIKRVFEAFAQADGSVTRQYGGTGLGLSITRELVQLMGGTVEATSAAGRGSAFSVRLPLLRVEAGAVPAVSAAGALAGASAGASSIAINQSVAITANPSSVEGEIRPPAHLGQAVLLAEDNEVNVYLFKAMLEGHGLEIDVASNGLTALDLAQSRRYALIFMDVQMPGMDGLSVTRELRRFEAESGRARMPIIALTANAYEADVESSLAAGCDQHIAKPFSKPQLVEALFRFVPVT